MSAQIVDAEGQYVDTVFNDHVDRTAEDFVIASLLVADPGTVMYSVLGHACLRLQCSAFGMDTASLTRARACKTECWTSSRAN